jgi:exonuclease III
MIPRAIPPLSPPAGDRADTEYNINNLNRRLPNLLVWLKAAQPDIVCLQELKCSDEEFPSEAIERAGYHAVFRGQKTWNGVATVSRRRPNFDPNCPSGQSS